MIMRLLLVLLIVLLSIDGKAKTFYDSPGKEIISLIQVARSKYIIQYDHVFSDTLRVPAICELRFNGGSLRGPIIFQNTRLSGKVDLKGSSLSGSLKNKKVNALWLCFADGVSDDAQNINQLIDICGNIFFPRGKYRLVSEYNPAGRLDKNRHKSVRAHIGINRSNVLIEGEEGTEFVTDEVLGTICVFSQPEMIKNSIRNITIDGITFTVHNNGVDFNEFMHTIKVIGVNGMTINSCFFNDFWGDAICLSHYGDTPKTGERSRNQNVRITNNTIIGGFHYNDRNGISVINGKKVLIKNNTIKNTSRDHVPGGIDVEPNNSAYTIENITIENNVLEGIRGSGGAICLGIYDGGPAHKVSIIGNSISNCSNGIQIFVKTEGTSDDIVIKNNYIAADTQPYRFVGEGFSKNWTISGNMFDRPCKQDLPGKIHVETLKVKKNKIKLVNN